MAFAFMASDPTPAGSLGGLVAGHMAVATIVFIAYRRLARTHGVKPVQSAMKGPMQALGVLALIGALVLFLGIPLYFLRLGGQLWK